MADMADLLGRIVGRVETMGSFIIQLLLRSRLAILSPMLRRSLQAFSLNPNLVGCLEN
jgi:hypothetical protein